MVAVTRKKRIQKGGSKIGPVNSYHGPGKIKRGAQQVGQAAKTLGKNVGLGVVGITGAVVAAPFAAAAAAAAAGVSGLAMAGKAIYRIPAAAIAGYKKKTSEETLTKKLGVNHAGISTNLSKLEIAKQKLDAEYSEKLAKSRESIMSGKKPNKKDKTTETLQKEYESKATALYTQIQKQHTSKELHQKNNTRKMQPIGPTNPNNKTTLSEKIDFALQKSKNNLEKKYENAKSEYRIKQQAAITSIKNGLDYDTKKQAHEKTRSELSTALSKFDTNKKNLDAKMSTDKNFIFTKEYAQNTKALETEKLEYNKKLKEYTTSSESINKLEKDFAKQIKTYGKKNRGKGEIGGLKDIEFYEGKAQSWRNTEKRHWHEMTEDIKDIGRATGRFGALGQSNLIAKKIGLNPISKREKVNYGIESEYEGKRTDINPFGFKPFSSKMSKIKSMETLFDGNTTTLKDFDTKITDLKSEIANVDILDFDTKTRKASTPEQETKIEEINKLQAGLKDLTMKNNKDFVQIAEYQNKLKQNISEFQNAELNALILDRSKRQKLLGIAESTTNNLIDDKQYAKNIKKLHENPEYNPLLSKMLKGEDKAEIINELTAKKAELIQQSESGSLESKIKVNEELQTVKKLLRYTEGKQLQEKIKAETQDLLTSQTNMEKAAKQKKANMELSAKIKQRNEDEKDPIKLNQFIIEDLAKLEEQKAELKEISTNYNNQKTFFDTKIKPEYVEVQKNINQITENIKITEAQITQSTKLINSNRVKYKTNEDNIINLESTRDILLENIEDAKLENDFKKIQNLEGELNTTNTVIEELENKNKLIIGSNNYYATRIANANNQLPILQNKLSEEKQNPILEAYKDRTKLLKETNESRKEQLKKFEENVEKIKLLRLKQKSLMPEPVETETEGP